jgi:hypothetical protein
MFECGSFGRLCRRFECSLYLERTSSERMESGFGSTRHGKWRRRGRIQEGDHCRCRSCESVIRYVFASTSSIGMSNYRKVLSILSPEMHSCVQILMMRVWDNANDEVHTIVCFRGSRREKPFVLRSSGTSKILEGSCMQQQQWASVKTQRLCHRAGVL